LRPAGDTGPTYIPFDLDARIRFLQRERFLLVTERQVEINVWEAKKKEHTVNRLMTNIAFRVEAVDSPGGKQILVRTVAPADCMVVGGEERGTAKAYILRGDRLQERQP
jgi:hypothetical protein